MNFSGERSLWVGDLGKDNDPAFHHGGSFPSSIPERTDCIEYEIGGRLGTRIATDDETEMMLFVCFQRLHWEYVRRGCSMLLVSLSF